MNTPGFKRRWSRPLRAFRGADLVNFTPRGRYLLDQSRARYLRRPDAYPIEQQTIRGELVEIESFRFIISPRLP